VADRWHQLADAIQASNLPASDKSVYRYLLDRADYGTVEMPAKFAPKQAVIARKTSHSLRQVRYAIRHLERHEWLTAAGRTGPGKSRRYTLSAGTGCNCAGRVHVPGTAATGNPERRQPDSQAAATIDNRTAATNGGNAAAQTPVPTERQREGRVGRKPEREPGPVLCLVCRTLMDPLLPSLGYRTHPCCDPDETPATAGQP
jgi:hypothetical protein